MHTTRAYSVSLKPAVEFQPMCIFEVATVLLECKILLDELFILFSELVVITDPFVR